MSTTVNAADITSEYTYKKYLTIKSGSETWYVILLSDNSISQRSISTSGSSAVDPNIGATVTLQGTYYVTTLNSGNLPNCCTLIYNGNNWEYRLPIYQITSASTVCALYKYLAGTVESNTKPSGFPTIDFGLSKSDVQKLINDQINSTTSVTTSAKNIQTQVTNAYVDYSDGRITLAQLQSTIDALASQLQALNNNASATLADKVAVNNAITQTQLVQDAANKDAIIQEMEQDLTVSTNISSQITGKINQANQIFNQYSQGSTTQTEAVTQINQYITQLTQLITPQTPTADINAINSAINTINGIKDSVTSHSELSPDVSEEQVKSDQEEIEMLNEMVSVMQDQVIEDKMEDQQIAGKADAINNILNPVWENKFFTYLIGTSSVLIIACILLHVRFRML